MADAFPDLQELFRGGRWEKTDGSRYVILRSTPQVRDGIAALGSLATISRDDAKYITVQFNMDSLAIPEAKPLFDYVEFQTASAPYKATR